MNRSRTTLLALGPGGQPYGARTQIAAAERFLRRHRGKVGLITVSIGGNDVTRCARVADVIPCVVAGGRLVDVTAASGAYGSLDARVTLPSGWRLIADLVVKGAAAAMSAAVYALPEEHEDFRATIRRLARERIAPRAAEIDSAD